MAWCGAARCQILSFMATKITSASKKKNNKSYDKILEKPSKMGKLSWVVCHGLLNGSGPDREVFTQNRGAACEVLMAKETLEK